jgi:hypothetical protein
MATEDPNMYGNPIYVAELDGSAPVAGWRLQPQTDERRSFSQSTTSSSSSLKKVVVVPQKVSTALHAEGFAVDDEGIVRWAPDSLTHPRQWPLGQKLYDTALICFLEFFVTLISNTGSSIAPLAAEELGTGRELALFCFTTLYLIGQAVGGLIFSPIAESFGGRTIYVFSTLGYALFSLFVALWPTLSVVVVGRLMTGLLSAIPAVVATSSIENM